MPVALFMRSGLLRRDIISDIQSAPETFSSWDSCMSKTYCKWPVIAAIIVGSLIVISVVWCLGRCLCCGLSCCCNCCRCLDCFTPKSRRNREQQDYSKMPPAPYTGYQPPPNNMSFQHRDGASFATFDTTNKPKIHEDSLPRMPTWNDAPTRHVEDFGQASRDKDVEMGNLPPQQTGVTKRGYNQIPNGPISLVHSNDAYRGAADDYFGQNNNHAGHQQQAASDIGAQTLGHYQQNNRHDFYDEPLSPAPTYRSNPASNSGRFAAGSASPAPAGYHNQSYNNGNNHYNSDPYSSSRGACAPSLSTRYEGNTAVQMPYPHSQPQQVEQYHSRNLSVESPPADNRPPSLLMIGRKPVKNSTREV